MTIKDRVGKRRAAQGMHNGKGEILYYVLFEGEIDPSMAFYDLLVKPGDYAGHHRHESNAEVLYVVSGKAENFQDGDRCILSPGDAMLVKPGQSHAIRSIGDEDLHLLAFGAVPIGEEVSVENLPLPDEISDWE